MQEFFKSKFEIIVYKSRVLNIFDYISYFKKFQALSSTGNVIKKGGKKVFNTLKKPSFMVGFGASEAIDGIGDAMETSSSDVESDKYYSAVSDPENDLTDFYTDYYEDYSDYENFAFDDELRNKITKIKSELNVLKKRFSSGSESIFKGGNFSILLVSIVFMILI